MGRKSNASVWPGPALYGAASLLLALAACARSATPHNYSIISGDVISCDAQNGDLMLQVAQREARQLPQPLHCIITRDSEIYINGQFSLIGEIQPGDRAEFAGYRELTPAPERFIVSQAELLRVMPAPRIPDILVSRSAQADR